jgi:hypothetical protein
MTVAFVVMLARPKPVPIRNTFPGAPPPGGAKSLEPSVSRTGVLAFRVRARVSQTIFSARDARKDSAPPCERGAILLVHRGDHDEGQDRREISHQMDGLEGDVEHRLKTLNGGIARECSLTAITDEYSALANDQAEVVTRREGFKPACRGGWVGSLAAPKFPDRRPSHAQIFSLVAGFSVPHAAGQIAPSLGGSLSDCA